MSYYLLKLRPGSQTTIIFLDNGYSKTFQEMTKESSIPRENFISCILICDAKCDLETWTMDTKVNTKNK